MRHQQAQQRTHRSKGIMILKKGGYFSGSEWGLLRLLRRRIFEYGSSI